MHLDRLPPENLDAEVVDGAVVVDTRPAPFRVAEGELPGALIVERNVLEWRFDPTSAARLPASNVGRCPSDRGLQRWLRVEPGRPARFSSSDYTGPPTLSVAIGLESLNPPGVVER